MYETKLLCLTDRGMIALRLDSMLFILIVIMDLTKNFASFIQNPQSSGVDLEAAHMWNRCVISYIYDERGAAASCRVCGCVTLSIVNFPGE